MESNGVMYKAGGSEVRVKSDTYTQTSTWVAKKWAAESFVLKDCEDSACPAGCGSIYLCMQFIQYKAPHLTRSRLKRCRKLNSAYENLKTAKIIYEGFMSICNSPRSGDPPPTRITYFNSNIDNLVITV